MIAAAPPPHRFWWRIGAAWLAVAALLVLRNLAAIRGFELNDPDDVLRLVQVRDLLGGQGWFELFQSRINPPGGVATHWSRLVDIPLAGTILALSPLLGRQVAELVAVIGVPLFTLLCAMLLTARIALRLFGAAAAYGACLAWTLAITAAAQLQPMRIDHHGWQIVAVLAAINGLLARDARRGGWAIGTALAAGLSISLEILPFTVLFAAVLGLRWLRDPADAPWLRNMLLSLAVVSGLCYAVTRGLNTVDNHCDTISSAYLAAFMLAGALVWAIAALRLTARVAIVAALGAAAGVTGLGYVWLAPQCLAGPFAELDPLVRDVWLSHVVEGLPVWHASPGVMAQAMIPPLAGLLIGGLVWRTATGRHRLLLADFALLLAGSVLIAALVLRFSAVAAAIATIPLGWLIARWWQGSNRMSLRLRLTSLLAAPLVLLPGAVVDLTLARTAPAPKAAVASNDVTPNIAQACGLPGSNAALRALPASTIFAPMDLGPAILLGTGHKVIATGHHRANLAMHDVIRAYTLPPAKAEAIVRGHQASYVIVCADLAEAQVYRTQAKDGLMAALLAGQTPAWLEPVPLASDAGSLRLWRVRPVRQS